MKDNNNIFRRIKNNKYIILFCLLAITYFIVSNIMQIYVNNKNLNKQLPEVKLRNVSPKNKLMAIMVSNNGGEDYVEYTDSKNEWPPTSKYTFNKEKTICLDSNGMITDIKIDFNNGVATLNSNKTLYCTMYFDAKKSISVLELLASKPKDLTESIVGDMHRYQAKATNKNEAAQMTNWICFGTTENCGVSDDLIDKYMYRIIGISDSGEMKLLKETYITESDYRGDYVQFSWNRTNRDYWEGEYPNCVDSSNYSWPNVILYERINGISNGSQSGGFENNSANSDIFVDSEYYDYLKSGDGIYGSDEPSLWYKLINNHNWMYGDAAIDDTTTLYNGNDIYAIESGNASTIIWNNPGYNRYKSSCTWSSTVSAKIGLMYIHDYIYSYPGGNPGNQENASTAWICSALSEIHGNDQSAFWFITRYGFYDTMDSNVNTFIVNTYKGTNSYGGISAYSFNSGNYVQPVFYIGPNIKLFGSGTLDDPFILEV